MSNLIAKIFLYCLPIILFFLMVLGQTSYHFLKYQKNKNAYIPKEKLLTLNSEELKRFDIYLDPIGHYFFGNKFIDLLFKNDEESNMFLQNIHFVKQDMFIYTGRVNPLSILMPNFERLLKSSIEVGVNKDSTLKLCYKPHIFQMLFNLETVSIFDLQGFASRFACDCNGYAIDSFDIDKLNNDQKVDYYNAYRAFIRESLNTLKPIKISTKLFFGDFFRYVIMSNITMGSPDLEARAKEGNNWVILFAIATYFLLAIQATILGTMWERIIS